MFNDEHFAKLEHSIGILVNKGSDLRTPGHVVFAIKDLLDPADKSLSDRAKKILHFTVAQKNVNG